MTVHRDCKVRAVERERKTEKTQNSERNAKHRQKKANDSWEEKGTDEKTHRSAKLPKTANASYATGNTAATDRLACAASHIGGWLRAGFTSSQKKRDEVMMFLSTSKSTRRSTMVFLLR
jgi:hypothetical protein